MPNIFSPASGFPASLFSPASFFLLLNLVIGTIVITSRFTSNRKHHEEEEEELRLPLTRAPSLLDRVKSINLSFRENSPLDSDISPDSLQTGYTNGVDHHPPPLERTPSLLQRLKSVNFSSLYRYDPAPELCDDSKHEVPEPELAGEIESEPEPEVVHHGVKRSKSEQGVVPERKEVAAKMKKSASEKAVSLEEAKERDRVELGRPQSARLDKTTSFGDEGVDAKADDFINRFKQQLKLQRLDSLLRYRDRLRGN